MEMCECSMWVAQRLVLAVEQLVQEEMIRVLRVARSMSSQCDEAVLLV